MRGGFFRGIRASLGIKFVVVLTLTAVVTLTVAAARLDEVREVRTINVKAPLYGAVGDGVADDTGAIASAVAAASGGKEVYFPPGTYKNTASIALPPGTVVYGEGIGSIISGPGLVLTDGDTVRDLRMRGAPSYDALSVDSAAPRSRFEVRNVRVENYRNGLYIDRTRNDGIHEKLEFTGNTFDNNAYGIFAIRVRSSLFRENTFVGNERPLEFWGGQSNRVLDNKIDGGVIGIGFVVHNMNRAQGVVRDNVVRGNEVRNVTEESISLDVRGNDPRGMGTRETDRVSSKPVSPEGEHRIVLSSPAWERSARSFRGYYAIFSSGRLKSEVFTIKDHPAGTGSLELDMTDDQYEAVEDGDEVIVGLPFYRNEIAYNTVDARKGLVAISLWGLCYDNSITGNEITGPGIKVSSLMGLDGSGSIVDMPGGRAAPSENNRVSGNSVADGDIILDLRNYSTRSSTYLSDGNAVTDNEIRNGRLVIEGHEDLAVRNRGTFSKVRIVVT